MKKDSRYRWYTIDILAFLILNIIILHYIDVQSAPILQQLNWMVIFIFALGVYRLTDIITQENVTDILRAPFRDKKIVNDKEVWEISDEGFRGFFGTLVSCNACMGVWVAMIIFYLFLLLPAATFTFMIIMALTGFERFFSKIYNFLEKRG